MGIKKMALAAALGLSMASAPVMAQTAAPVAVERSSASLDETNAQEQGFPFLIVLAVIAAGAGIYFAVNNDDDDRPVSR